MKKTVYPRGPKALRDFMAEHTTELELLLSHVELRTVRRHSTIGAPDVEIAATYEVFARIPAIAWLDRAALKKRGLTTKDVDQAFERIASNSEGKLKTIARLASEVAHCAPHFAAQVAEMVSALGIPTKPTKPPTLHDVGEIRLVRVVRPDGQWSMMAGKVVKVNGDERTLRFSPTKEESFEEVWTVDQIGSGT